MNNYIAKFRKSYNLTQSQLSDMCGCARETIANLEKGRYNPSLALSFRILAAFNSADDNKMGYQLEDVFPNPYA